MTSILLFAKMLLVLLVFFACPGFSQTAQVGQYWSPILLSTTEISTSDFVSDAGNPGLSGVKWLQVWGTTINEVVSIGQPIQAAVTFNISGIVNATSLTYGIAFRDTTVMPTVTFADFALAVAQGTTLASVSSTSIFAPKLSGVTNQTTTMFNFVAGSLDSYNNVISSGDVLFIDAMLYSTSAADNINATINTWLLAPYIYYV